MPHPAPLPPEVLNFIEWAAGVLSDVYIQERSTTPPAAEPPATEDPEKQK